MDVLSVALGNPLATVVANLENANSILDSSYDCLVVTRTLQRMYNFGAAIGTLHRILRPGRVALVTVPGISKIARDDVDDWSAQRTFDDQSAARAFSKIFGKESVSVAAHGSVPAAVVFLHGLGICERKVAELQYDDQEFPLIVEVRAQKT